MFRLLPALFLIACSTAISAKEIYDPTPKVLQGPEGSVRRLQFSPSDKLLASVHNLREVIVWDIATGKRIFEKKYDKRIDAHTVSFSPDSEWIAISTDKQIEVFEVSSGKLQHTIKGGSHGLFSPKEKVVVYTLDKKLMLHDFKKEDRVLFQSRTEKDVYPLSISPNGKHLIFMSDSTFYVQSLEDETRINIDKDDDGQIASIDFSMQSDKVIINYFRKELRTYEIKTGKPLRESKLDEKSEHSFFRFEAVGGRYLFGGGNWTSRVYVYDPATLKEVDRIELGKSPNSIASTSTGDLIAVGFGDSIAEKWNCQKGEIWLYSAGKGNR